MHAYTISLFLVRAAFLTDIHPFPVQSNTVTDLTHFGSEIPLEKIWIRIQRDFELLHARSNRSIFAVNNCGAGSFPLHGMVCVVMTTACNVEVVGLHFVLGPDGVLAH